MLGISSLVNLNSRDLDNSIILIIALIVGKYSTLGRNVQRIYYSYLKFIFIIFVLEIIIFTFKVI